LAVLKRLGKIEMTTLCLRFFLGVQTMTEGFARRLMNYPGEVPAPLSKLLQRGLQSIDQIIGGIDGKALQLTNRRPIQDVLLNLFTGRLNEMQGFLFLTFPFWQLDSQVFHAKDTLDQGIDVPHRCQIDKEMGACYLILCQGILHTLGCTDYNMAKR
jgi:hypothetical protein